MKKTIIFPAVAACAFLIHGTVIAGDSQGAVSTHGTADMYQLMKDRGYRCLECHDVDRQVVGPSWREVAANRRGHPWAHELIVHKISTGSVGEYGKGAMPHNEVQEQDLDIIADWILSLSGPAPEVPSSP